MIELRNLTKTFGDFTAVSHLNIKIETGEFFGLLGPNGAGKTTTISMISTVILPTEGEVLVDGHPLTRKNSEQKRKLSVITQEYSMRQDMTVSEVMEYQGRLYYLPKKLIKEKTDSGLKVACPSLIFSFREYSNFGFNALDDENSVFLNAYKKFRGEDYPALDIDKKISILPEEISGESVSDKIKKVQNKLVEKDIFYFFSAALDVNMWLLNIRGNAIKYNPLALSYVVITQNAATAFLYGSDGYADTKEFKEVMDYLEKNHVKVLLYDNFERFINILLLSC